MQILNKKVFLGTVFVVMVEKKKGDNLQHAKNTSMCYVF